MHLKIRNILSFWDYRFLHERQIVSTSHRVLNAATLQPISRVQAVIGFSSSVSASTIIMNCEVCQLKELEVEHFQIHEVLSCILHTIVFHRALGLVRPKDVDLELFEITYVQCGDAEIEKKIREKIEEFISWVEKHPNKKSQICLSFYEVKSKQQSWFTNKTERLYWERWYVNLNVTQHPRAHSGKSHHSKVVVDPGESESEERSVRRAALEASIREVMFQIIKFANEKKDHVPSISEGIIHFPYEITFPSSSDSAFGMDVIKRMLQTGHPTMLS
ncbi:hypothetical protein SLEP1_g8127 [Rubroshorea leprosula]|uniref:Autophagy-related protein 101 n=1 Tax=Rubroshorea leprosula TaxID=152421 RepID=A0AAV5I9Y0_9ROSI|nr:hypothetical protein SLEP1_g8127 [Rubroshorea leprosula]